MKNTDNFNKNFKKNKGENRKALRQNILNDRDWVKAFLQAQIDMRELRTNRIIRNVAY